MNSEEMIMNQQGAPHISWPQIVDRQTGLLSTRQNEIIRNTRVLMLGLGGMGMNAASHLVRMGFEHFTLVDFDAIDGTSANRTPFTYDDTLGTQKVEATKHYMRKINPRARIETHPHVKLQLDCDPEFMIGLVERHDVISWAMDGISGRIYYTRVTHEIGAGYAMGKPAVESWGVPYHFCVWTVPNSESTPRWEELFLLPTVSKDIADITQEEVKVAQKLFFGRLSRIPHLLGTLDPALMKRWLGLEIPNRTIGPYVVGSTTLIAHELLLNALRLGGEPLNHADVHFAPWMAFYDVRRHTAYEYNFQTNQVRWRHPLTGRMRCERLLHAMSSMA
jgi:hypothetical protein